MASSVPRSFHCDTGLSQVHALWMQMIVLSFLSASVKDAESSTAIESWDSEMAEWWILVHSDPKPGLVLTLLSKTSLLQISVNDSLSENCLRNTN